MKYFTHSEAGERLHPTMSSFVTKQPSELRMFKTPGSRVLYHRLETGAHLILIGLLSLGPLGSDLGDCGLIDLERGRAAIA